MKKLGFFGKLIFWCNSLVAFLLVVSFVLPYLKPSSFPTLSLLSLLVSPLILLNLLFALYWLIQFKRPFWLSFAVLVIASFQFSSFFEFSSEGDPSAYKNTLRIVSYNVRLFNAYEENNTDNVSEVIQKIIAEEQPDVFSIQEFYREPKANFDAFPYQYIHFKNKSAKLGHAVFSKFPIVHSGAFDFKDSYNNTLYVDIVKGTDTLRIYNLHLQSLGILPKVDYLQEGDKDRLRARIANAFSLQEKQAIEILEHRRQSPYPTIVAGDFNNTPFSYVYRTLNKDMQDAFLERGSGLGTTFNFDGYPMRIDYIFTSETLDVLNFETLENTFSDHYPVRATVGW